MESSTFGVVLVIVALVVVIIAEIMLFLYTQKK